MSIFVFDIETIPDTDAGRKLYGFQDLSDAEVAHAMMSLQKQKSHDTFLKHHCQRIVAISVVLRTEQQLQVWSLGSPEAGEREIIERFFAGIEKTRPVLVSWNGSGFDCPVIHYRSMIHGITASQYWETGEQQSDFRWNNYLNRYHYRHMDLMDILSGYQARAYASLNDMAVLLGYPGKLGMDGSDVWPAYQAGDIECIRHYCEMDVMNTYLIYCRFELMRGRYTPEQYQAECEFVRTTLAGLQKPHWQSFLDAWGV